MALNDPYAAGTVRAPRMQILNNGAPIGGPLSFTVHSNSYYGADTFSCQFSLYATPETGLAFWGDPAWDDANPMMLDIQASLDGGQTFTSLILGQCDHIVVHLDAGIVQVDGRDRTASFIDAKTQETFQNQTASQVVQTLAARHGMTADVTPTSTLVGRFYQIDHENIGAGQFTRTTTEWNLICSFASKEQYDVWVTGNTIHFHPYTDRNPDPYLVVWDKSEPFSNVMEITVQRSLTFAKDIVVVVRSWNSKQAAAVVKYAPAGASATQGKAPQFSYVFPNLSEAEAQAKANEIRGQLIRHERLLEFTCPADLTLSARNFAQVTGSQSSWDQVFLIDSIERSMAWDSGFVQRVQAKNAT